MQAETNIHLAQAEAITYVFKSFGRALSSRSMSRSLKQQEAVKHIVLHPNSKASSWALRGLEVEGRSGHNRGDMHTTVPAAFAMFAVRGISMHRTGFG